MIISKEIYNKTRYQKAKIITEVVKPFVEYGWMARILKITKRERNPNSNSNTNIKAIAFDLMECYFEES